MFASVAIRIDHIGSTSVPGLAAKDVIDIQVTVPDFMRWDELEPLISRSGYVVTPVRTDHRPPRAGGPESDWEKRFFQASAGARRVHVHVRVDGRANQRYALLFRDYLRAHVGAAEAYAELKRRLASLGIDLRTYAEVKDPVCDLIMDAAGPWADATGWMPGPSDA